MYFYTPYGIQAWLYRKRRLTFRSNWLTQVAAFRFAIVKKTMVVRSVQYYVPGIATYCRLCTIIRAVEAAATAVQVQQLLVLLLLLL